MKQNQCGKLFLILKKIIRKFFIHNYDVRIFTPTALYSICQKLLSKCRRELFNRKLQLCNYQYKNITPKHIIRLNQDCNCNICKVGKSSTIFRDVPKQEKVRRPSIAGSREHTKKIKVCNLCLTKTQRGKQHVCKEAARNKNIINFAQKRSSIKSKK